MSLDELDEGGELPDLPLLSNSSGIADSNYLPCRFTTPLGVTIQLIPISYTENKLLVCVPFQVWSRAVAQRVLPTDSLAKPISAEIYVACREDRTARADDAALVKVWIGLLKQSYLGLITVDEEDYPFDYVFKSGAIEQALPLAQGLVDAANDHFGFVSVEEGPEQDDPGAEDAGLGQRVSAIEAMLQKMASNLDALTGTLQSKVASAPPPKATAPRLGPRPKAALSDTSAYPDLDPTVVSSALAAGVPPQNLQQMQAMMFSTKMQAKTLEPVPAKKATMYLAPAQKLPMPLEVEDEQLDDGLDGEPLSPSFQDALTKLTQIVTLLTDEKAKKAKQTGIEAALESVHSSSSSDVTGVGSGKRAAAARRALRTALLEAPQEIAALLEKLMLEDLTSRTITPGMPRVEFSARAWVEHRSKISAHKTAAFSAWSAAGILDDLVAGNVMGARARASLLLLQLDQMSVDRGSWTLASELTLEAAPPMSTLAQHVPPAIQDGEAPYSRLLDPRWSEVALAHLSETDNYLAKRKTVGKKASEDQIGSFQPSAKPKPKGKPKAKGAASSHQSTEMADA